MSKYDEAERHAIKELDPSISRWLQWIEK